MSAQVHRLEPPMLDVETELAALDARLAELAGSAPPAASQPVGWHVAPLARRFALDAFEQRVLLLAAAAELRGSTRDLVARFGAGPPSIGLAIRVCQAEADMPEACWRALRPDGALRRGRLIVLGEAHARFTERPVWLEEPVLQALHGQMQLDEEVLALALDLPPDLGAGAPRAAVGAVIDAMAGKGGTPLLQLAAHDVQDALAVARAAIVEAGLGTVALPLSALPRDGRALAALRQAWLRDAMIHQLGLVLVGDGSVGDGSTGGAPVELVTGWSTPVMVVGAELPAAACGQRVALETGGDVHAALWAEALGGRAPDLAARLAHSFRLPAARVHAIGQANREPDAVWAAARAAARPRDGGLCERIEPRVAMDEVIVPDQVGEVLRAIVHAGRGHHRVARDWGAGRSGERGLAVTALFSGASGTGKTMAAEAVARELGLDLYRVELSAVVSKYIGETERNLRRVFAETEQAGGMLLFDEADALFGKRSEVRDSHDRYANMEVGYLLQQMESYRGIAVLTTNMPDAIDSAFVRRLRYIARFPLPGAPERQRIWEGAFPATVACEPLDFSRLAKLSLTGAVIRNVALGASFRAGGEGRGVTMADVVAAARMELVKLGRPLTEIDGRDWS